MYCYIVVVKEKAQVSWNHKMKLDWTETENGNPPLPAQAYGESSIIVVWLYSVHFLVLLREVKEAFSVKDAYVTR